jgi:hypothetical protein
VEANVQRLEAERVVQQDEILSLRLALEELEELQAQVQAPVAGKAPPPPPEEEIDIVGLDPVAEEAVPFAPEVDPFVPEHLEGFDIQMEDNLGGIHVEHFFEWVKWKKRNLLPMVSTCPDKADGLEKK